MSAESGWDGWDRDRVYGVLWPETREWADRAEFWPATPAPVPGGDGSLVPPVRAGDVPLTGPAYLTYWVWAVGTPFVKIGRTQARLDRDRRWRGNLALVRRRVAEWSTGSPWELEVLRFAIGDASAEHHEHRLRAAARMPDREWFDLRRLDQA